MLAPPSFNLPDFVDNSKHSPPAPSTYLKHQVYDDPLVFEKVDSHAIRVSQSTYPVFRDLLWDLVYRYKLSDLEKARVIFRWMTACDMKNLQFQSSPPGSPEEVLLSLKNLQGSYASAYEVMCSYAGLQCLTITGYAKGVDYRPGDEFKPGNYNHTWNVIFLQGSWQLIDAHWATRYLTSSKNAKDSIVYQYDDFYFIMEPQQAVYSHFPQDSAWQLLERPLTVNQFVHLPLTKSQFFKCGMDFQQQQHGVVQSRDGNLKMSLGFWKPDSFTYKLQTADNVDQFKGIPLRHFVLQETANNHINFYFRFPFPGVFYLTIFAQELTDMTKSGSAGETQHENVYRAACEYRIEADCAAANHTPYPMTCHDCNWGPSWSLMGQYGLVPQQEDGLITLAMNPHAGWTPNCGRAPSAHLEVPFERQQGDVSLMCKLRKNGLEDEDVLDQFIDFKETPDRTVFKIDLPEPGEYGMEIYANEPSEGDTFTHVCQYLLDFEAPAGYKPGQSVSVLGGAKPDLTAKVNPRDMYNYEKDATPLGTLPQPYKATQYTPEEATMIPGQQKMKPKPFAYQQQKNPATHKSDESDMEMPDFPPPPPPPTNGGSSEDPHSKSHAQHENKVPFGIHGNVSGGLNLKPGDPGYSSSNQGPNFNRPGDKHDPNYNSNNQFGGGNSGGRVLQPGDPGYSSSSQGPNFNRPGDKHDPNYNSNNQFGGGNSGGRVLQPGDPGYSSSSQGPNFNRPGDKHDPNYNSNNQFGGGNSGGRVLQPGDPGYNADKQGSNFQRPGDKPGIGGHVNPKFSQIQSATPFSKQSLGDLDSESVRLQPYLANIEKGGSPLLSRKVYDAGKANRDGSPGSSGASWKKGAAQNRDSSPGNQARGQVRNPDLPPQPPTGDYEPDPEGNIIASSSQRPQYAAELSGLNMVSSAFGDNRGSGRQPYLASLETGGSPSLTHRIAGPSTGLRSQASVESANQENKNQWGPNSGFGKEDPNRPIGKENTNSDLNRPSPFRGYGRPNFSNNAAATTPSGPEITPSALIGQYSTPSQATGQPVVQSLAGPGFKDQHAKLANPGYQLGSYTNKQTPVASGTSGDSRRDGHPDSNKVSNIAVTLSPSGYKKPDRIQLTSDQYNNQYEGSTKVMPSPLQKYRPDDSTANWTSGPVQKEPPTNFEPKPMVIAELEKPKLEALPSEAPVETAISPEETSKIFQKVDEHAMQVSAQNQDSFNQLIWQLIYARNITDELEKVRAIFLWLCTKDLHKMKFDTSIKQDSPEEILMGIKGGRSTYAHVFQTLCRYAGVHCKLIVGYAKGADYAPGMRFQGRLGEHTWNAVLIAGVWRLVDCHWAARRLIGKDHVPENVRYELDMFYFLANPSQLVYTHFPHDKDWQLLHHPVNIEEFESLAPVKSMFFKYNLDLLSHKNAVIQTRQPETELRIAFPKGVDERLLFTFTLSFHDGPETFQNIPLSRYGRQEIDFQNNQSVFWIRTPVSGSYKLLLYAKLIGSESSEDSSSSNKQKMFGAICEYKIEATLDLPPSDTVPPFPECHSCTYGPTDNFKQYAVEPQEYCCSFYSESGTAEVRFGLRQTDLRVMAKLVSNQNSNSDALTESCVIQRIVAGHEAVITVFLPTPGEFGLEVYANDPKKNGNNFFPVWQYFVVSGRASAVTGRLPSLPPGSLGPFEPRFSSTCGLTALSHRDPFIMLESSRLSVELGTSRELPVRLMGRVLPCEPGHEAAAVEPPSWVLQQTRADKVRLDIQLPPPTQKSSSGGGSFFKLQIFGLPYSQQSESLPGVYSYLIQTNLASSTSAISQSNQGYPQQFGQWREGGYLYEPLDGVLSLKRVGSSNTMDFKMEVPRAKELAVVSPGGDWTKLTLTTDSATGTSLWQAKAVPIGQDIGELSVCANYGGVAGDSFTTILRYRVEP